MNQKKLIIHAAKRRSLPRLDPSYSLVRALGGPSKVSVEVGITQSRVSQWSALSEKGGCGGLIPPDHYPTIIRMCERLAVPFAFNSDGRLCLDVAKYEKQKAKRSKSR